MTVIEKLVLPLSFSLLEKVCLGYYSYLLTLTKKRLTQRNEASKFEDKNKSIDMDPTVCVDVGVCQNSHACHIILF